MQGVRVEVYLLEGVSPVQLVKRAQPCSIRGCAAEEGCGRETVRFCFIVCGTL